MISLLGYVFISIISPSRFVISPVITIGTSPPKYIFTQVFGNKSCCLAYPGSSLRLNNEIDEIVELSIVLFSFRFNS